MPPSWKMCTNPIIAWAVGSEGGGEGGGEGGEGGEGGNGASFFMMEIHYDNPNLNTGESVSPHLIIPPSSTFHTTAYCPGSCTEENFPQGGLHIFQGLLHSHLLGTSLSLRQVREGVELPPILQDNNYDFNFQQSRVLKKEVTILPGDSLITQCVFTSERKEPAFGGLRTQDEMCLAYLSYYPKIKMGGCMSHQPTSNLLQAVGVKEVYEDVDMMKMVFDEHTKDNSESEWNNKNKDGKRRRKKKKEGEEEEEEEEKKNEGVKAMKEMLWLLKAKSPQRYANQTLYQILHNPKTWEEKDEDGVGLMGRMQKLAKDGVQISYCLAEKSYKKNTMVWSGSVPSFTPYQEPPSNSLCPHNVKSEAVEPEIFIN
ncbi:hypothetical protein Pmani_012019 [Petrolisthes manimaculis]|uniref:Copper type II ascorbate-dependent monooxygenase C-terminal domain-containing protein n=1 Tax=Petrolisthes manimaculis TaxID=1843537 RepID=A0AAE1UAW5_9EUCA|nr:hypothetical protein Pmani_012019 [Petrolisthes manimaculis]